MLSLSGGSFRLFRVAGITVFLHWSWLVVAYIELGQGIRPYRHPAWNVVEYLTLFAIVLLHEFGHALACRQVGGQAERIVLWPLGGVAYVNPPARPGAWLWSIAAGPLVNVALVPVTFGLFLLARNAGWHHRLPDAALYLRSIAFVNLGLLVFNLLPIYPLDGGQLLHGLLWPLLGRGRSLQAASVVGLLGGTGLVLLAVAVGQGWLIVLAVFLTFGALGGLQRGALLHRQPAAVPAADGFARCSCGPDTNSASEHRQYGDALYLARRYEQAVAEYTEALRLQPNWREVLNQRGIAYGKLGSDDLAVADYSAAIALAPGLARQYLNRALAYCRMRRYDLAIADYQEAVRRDPTFADGWNNLAWLLATCPEEHHRDGGKAVEYALRACELSDWKDARHLGTLSAAHAEVGSFAEAVRWQRQALADPDYEESQGDAGRRRLQLYEECRPFRQGAAV
jgi:Zn-dependent protease/Tfp pilus assembly protein PilF